MTTIARVIGYVLLTPDAPCFGITVLKDLETERQVVQVVNKDKLIERFDFSELAQVRPVDTNILVKVGGEALYCYVSDESGLSRVTISNYSGVSARVSADLRNKRSVINPAFAIEMAEFTVDADASKDAKQRLTESLSLASHKSRDYFLSNEVIKPYIRKLMPDLIPEIVDRMFMRTTSTGKVEFRFPNQFDHQVRRRIMSAASSHLKNFLKKDEMEVGDIEFDTEEPETKSLTEELWNYKFQAKAAKLWHEGLVDTSYYMGRNASFVLSGFSGEKVHSDLRRLYQATSEEISKRNFPLSRKTALRIVEGIPVSLKSIAAFSIAVDLSKAWSDSGIVPGVDIILVRVRRNSIPESFQRFLEIEGINPRTFMNRSITVSLAWFVYVNSGLYSAGHFDNFFGLSPYARGASLAEVVSFDTLHRVFLFTHSDHFQNEEFLDQTKNVRAFSPMFAGITSDN